MNMENGLSGAGTNIQNGPISLLDAAFARNLRGGEMASPNCLSIILLRFLQSGKMPLRNNQNVSGRLRADVLKSINVLVFVNFPGGNLASDDSAEKAV